MARAVSEERSPEMVRLIYFLHKYTRATTCDRYQPPTEFGNLNTRQVYDQFFEQLGGGRSSETFRGSAEGLRKGNIKEHLEDGTPFLPKCEVILQSWQHLPREQQWAYLQPFLDQQSALRNEVRMPASNRTALSATRTVLPASLPPQAAEAEDEEYAEGKERLQLHRRLERNLTLVRRKKAQVSTASGKLACEACDFDFARFYGDLGAGFAECHHTRPMAEVRVERKTKLSELAVVCSNCHRMLHRRPFYTVDQLRRVILALKAQRQPEPLLWPANLSKNENPPSA